MKYFIGVTDIEQAKLQYRKLAKQLHPDAGGTTHEFQKLQDEYKALLLGLHKNRKPVINKQQKTQENELLNELGKLTEVLIKKQVPQDFLRNKIHTAEFQLKKKMYSDIINLLDSIY